MTKQQALSLVAMIKKYGKQERQDACSMGPGMCGYEPENPRILLEKIEKKIMKLATE